MRHITGPTPPITLSEGVFVCVQMNHEHLEPHNGTLILREYHELFGVIGGYSMGLNQDTFVISMEFFVAFIGPCTRILFQLQLLHTVNELFLRAV